jgi:cobalt/nickel transport system permease protein
MHIPDGFLATPVWAALDAAAAPAVGYLARRAKRQVEPARVPMLGVLGAFVFAAQMINFPVGPGTSGHLVGAALLAFTLGPAAAGVVLTAILAIQALVFQDGGILALGANVINMAVLGTLAGYLPFYFWGAGPWRRAAIFLGGALSVLVSALAALSELVVSGVAIPAPVAGVSLALFVMSAILEGAITLAVVEALEKMNPAFIAKPAVNRTVGLAVLASAAVLLVTLGVLLASALPDGIQKLASDVGIASQARSLVTGPLAGYQAVSIGSPWLRKAIAGAAGLILVFSACVLAGKLVRRQRSA